MTLTIACLARVDADPEQVRLEAIRSAAQQGANILGDPTVQTSGTITANGEPVTLDDSGLALYTWTAQRAYTGLDNAGPALLSPHT